MDRNKHIIMRILTFLFSAMLMMNNHGLISFAAKDANGEQTRVNTWEQLQTAVNRGGEIILGRSVTAGESDGPLTVPADVRLTLNLNGCNIDRGLGNADACFDGSVIVNNGTLTIMDSHTGFKGRITGGNNLGDGGGIVNRGTLILENGTITRNRAGRSGGGIHNTGTLTMTGGIISYNTAVAYHGGGIYNNGTMTMTGGQIQENKAPGEESNGQGGAILQNGTLNVSGNPIVKNNSAKQGDNIYLRKEHPTMTVTGAFTEGAVLGVTAAGKTGVITSGYSKYNGQDKDPQFVFDSDEGYLIRLINNEAKLVTGANLVNYSVKSWNGREVVSTYNETDEYTLMSDVKDAGSTQLQSGIYVARGETTFKNRIGVAPGADVTLVLCDSSKLIMKTGIRVNGSDSRLQICGQRYNSGVLEAQSYTDAAIGADSKKDGGTIEFHGGSVSATAGGGNDSAAIGGGSKSENAGKILIYGGLVEANSKYSGAGIGSGFESGSSEITIYGGTVNAVAVDGAAIGGGCTDKTTNQYFGYGPIIIHGGKINAEACGAGIGAGNNVQNPRIEIYGGDITAVCRADVESGAGIGAGRYADQKHHIVIEGGRVIATSYGGAGIGAGARNDGGIIDIYDGIVIAIAENGGAGIGGGRRGGNGGTVTIKNGYVVAAALKDEGVDTQNRLTRMATAFEAGGHGKPGLTGAAFLQWVGTIVRAAADDECGAGIGGGFKGKGGDVKISGGYVAASSSAGKARAIGHGTSNSTTGKLELNPGAAVYTGKDEDSAIYTPYEDRVKACQSNRYALILPCLHENSIITATEKTHRISCLYCTQLSEKDEPHEWNEAGDHCVICNYHKKLSEYTIRFDPNGGKGDMQPVKINDGEKYELPSCRFTPPEGMTFDKWMVTVGASASVPKKPGQEITVTDDIEVKALWKDLHTVTFVSEDDTDGMPQAQTVADGERARKPDDPRRGGYVFRYWKLKGTEKEYDFSREVLSDITLEAVWEKIQTELIITAKPKTYVYNGKTQGPAGTYTEGIDSYVTVEGLKSGDALTGITLSGAGTDAGEYEIAPSAAVISGNEGNYSEIIYRKGTLTITKAPNPVLIAANAAVTRGGNTVDLSKNVKDAVGDVSYSISGDTNGCTLDAGTGRLTSGDETGKCIVSVTVAESGNYLGTTKNITVSIEDKEIVPLKVTQKDAVYGRDPEEPVYTDADGNPVSTDGSAVNISYSGSSYGPSDDKPSDAGKYTVTVTIETSKKIYTGTASFEIVPKEVRVNADDKTKSFGDSDPVLTASISDADGKPAEAAGVTYTLSRISGENVGEYVIMPSGAVRQGNYFVTYRAGKLTVTQAPNPAVIITEAAVTRDGNKVDLSGNVKYAEGDVTYDISGEANGCTVDKNTGLFTSGNATGTCIVAVTVKGNANYLGTTKNITVSIKDKEIVPLKVTQGDSVYGDEPEDPVYTNQDGNQVIIPVGSTAEISYSGRSYGPSGDKPSDAGKYTVTVTIETNEKIYTGSAEFSIERKEVTVKAENDYKHYGDTDPELEADISVDGEIDSTVNVDYSLSRIPGENVGKYEIMPSGAVIQGNYSVGYLPGILTISPADEDKLGLRAAGYEGVYDGQIHNVEANVKITDGTIIEYSTDDGDTWSTEAPGIRDADEDEKNVLVRATNRNYRTATEKVRLIVKKAESVITKAPKANELSYTVSEQELVTAGEAVGGTMQYVLGKDPDIAPERGWNTTVPAATGAGTYCVWYRVAGDANHKDIDPLCLTVTIAGDPDPSGGGGGAGGGGDPADDDVLRVIDMINALPAPEAVEVRDEAAIIAAREAFDKLTEDQKKDPSLTQALKDKLKDCVAQLEAAKKNAEDHKAAAVVSEMIAAIPDDLAKSSKTKVRKAREAYEALNDSAKKFITKEELSKLERSEYYWAKVNAKAQKVKMKSVRAVKGRKALAKWRKNSNADGYQLAYSTGRKFTKKTTKMVTIKSSKTVKKTVSKLKAGRKYYFRLRPYTLLNNPATGKNVKICGKWSKVKKVKARK